MSIYLRDIQAYDPEDFGSDVQTLIENAIKEVPLKDIFDSESSFYDNLIQGIKDVLYEFCDSVVDEAYDQGYESGDEAGYERCWDYASEEMYSAEYVSDLEDDLSNLRSEVSEKDEEIENLQAELDECRQSQTPDLDIDDIREAIRADLIAEMTPDDQD